MYKHKMFWSYKELIEFLNNMKIKKENIISINKASDDHWVDLIYK